MSKPQFQYFVLGVTFCPLGGSTVDGFGISIRRQNARNFEGVLMRGVNAVLIAVVVAGCATVEPAPNMRPLTQAHIDTVAATPVVLIENNNGVEKAWFYTSTASAGAAYGLVGALVSAAMDAIINYGPSQRAQRAANEVAEEVPLAELNASLSAEFQKLIPTGDAPTAGVRFSTIRAEQLAGVAKPPPVLDALKISLQYTLSEDASTLRVIANAAYESPRTPYRTPYTFKNIPKSETVGPAYRNTFTYYSAELPIPVLSPELKERLVASIESSARDEKGALPVEGSKEANAMKRDIENARDDKLTKDEIAIFLAREWVRDDGAALRKEIEQAHAFIAKTALADLNRTTTPSFTGEDELVETLADNRTVRRIGKGSAAGSYVSSAANVGNFSTYGNAISIAKSHADRVNALQKAKR